MNLSLSNFESGWRPPVLKTSALKGEGVRELADAIEKHKQFIEQNGMRSKKEHERIEDELMNVLQRELVQRAIANASRERVNDLVERVARRETDVYSATEEILGMTKDERRRTETSR